MIPKSRSQLCKEYYQRNRVNRIKQIVEWQSKNYDKQKSYSRKYYYKNREEINKKKRYISII